MNFLLSVNSSREMGNPEVVGICITGLLLKDQF